MEKRRDTVCCEDRICEGVASGFFTFLKLSYIISAFFIILFFFSTATIAADLYVAKTGQTYKTIQSAVDAANSGDNIYVYHSTEPYHEEIVIGAGKNNITITAEDATKPPVIDGADQSFNDSSRVWSAVDANVYSTDFVWKDINGLEKVHPTDAVFTKYRGGIYEAPMQVYENDTMLRGYRNRYDPDFPVSCSGSPTSLFCGGAYRTDDELDPDNDNGILPADYERDSISIHGRFRYDQSAKMLYIRTAENDVLPGNNTYNIPVIDNLITIKSAGVTISNLVLKHSSKYAVTVENGGNAVIDNNYFINNHYDIYINNSSDVTISNNFIQQKGFWERYHYDDAKGTLLWSQAVRVDGGSNSSNANIHHNVVTGKYVAIRTRGLNMQVHDNIFSRAISTIINATEYHGVDPYNLKIYNNVLHHAGKYGIGISNMSKGPVWMYRNVMYANPAPLISGNISDRGDPGESYFYHNTVALSSYSLKAAYNIPEKKNVQFRNNIFQLRFKEWELFWNYDIQAWGQYPLGFFPFDGGPDADFNIYWNQAKSNKDRIGKFGGTYKFYEGMFSYMARAIGLEPHGREIDPLFINGVDIGAADVFALQYDNISSMNYEDIITNGGFENLFPGSFDSLYRFFDVSSESQALDRGVVLPDTWPDMPEVIENGLPDLGAVEYSVSYPSLAPERSAATPAGTLPFGTTSTKLSIKTERPASCKYNVNQGVDYNSMTNSLVADVSSTIHGVDIGGIFDSSNYFYYVRCKDTKGGMVNTDDAVVSFSVAPVPDSGLLAYWSMDADDYKDNIIYDHSGNQYDSINNNVTVDTGISAEAASFNGTTSFLRVYDYKYKKDDQEVNQAESGLAFNSGDFTIHAWIKASAASAHGGIYSKGLGATGKGEFAFYIASGNNKLRFIMQGDKTQEGNQVLKRLDGATVIADDQWHHVSVVRENKTLSLYVDGSLEVSKLFLYENYILDADEILDVDGNGVADVNEDYFVNTPSLNSIDFPKIGLMDAATSNRYYNGLIDELYLYKRALSGTELGDVFAIQDEDRDGTINQLDNCPFDSNSAQINSDVDSFGDACDDFPSDPAEWLDTDGDGIGNNADQDDDNDGFSDGDEVTASTDPLDNTSFAPDGDINMDGLVNVIDIMTGQQILAGQVTLDQQQINHGDVAPLVGGVPAPDGEFNLSDVLIIQRKAIGVIDF